MEERIRSKEHMRKGEMGSRSSILRKPKVLSQHNMVQRALELFYLTRKPVIGKRRKERKRNGLKANQEEKGTGNKFRKIFVRI